MATSIPSGISTSIPRRLLARAPFSTSFFAPRRTPPRRHRNRDLPATDTSPVSDAGIRLNLRQHALGQHLAAKLARARTQVQQVIRRAQHVRIVLHHHNRVPQVAQVLQDPNQPVRVPRMQPDRRLIQHVERAHQLRAQRSRQLNPLRLAARQVEASRSSVRYSSPTASRNVSRCAPLPECCPAISSCIGVSFSARKTPSPAQSSAPWPGRCSAPVIVAIRTARASARSRCPLHSGHSRVSAILAQHHAHVQLVLLALHLREKPVHALEAALPASTTSRAAPRVISRHGTSSGTPSAAACFLNSVNQADTSADSTDRSRRHSGFNPLSGITRFKSKSTVFPNPWHRGHAPNGLLKLEQARLRLAVQPMAIHALECRRKTAAVPARRLSRSVLAASARAAQTSSKITSPASR